MRRRKTTQPGQSLMQGDGSRAPADASRHEAPQAAIGELDAYLAHLAHLDMPLPMKIELIAALRAIMQSFVDRAFGDDPVQRALLADGKPIKKDDPVVPPC